ncbi:Hypothetical protein D9617_36g063230 [Elsinoe fawcettii]|nr:Hypothetical protein D9617_36g063230 [Elsinoe fawcettii]
MVDVVPSNPQLKDLSTLQDSILSPLPFCKVWLKKPRDVTPFSRLSPATVSRLCNAIVKRPSLITPNTKTSTQSVTTKKVSSSTSTSTKSATTVHSASSLSTTTRAINSTVLQTSSASNTRVLDTTSTTSAASKTPLITTTSAWPSPTQLVVNPALAGSGTNYVDTGDLVLNNWTINGAIGHTIYQPSGSSAPLHALQMFSNKTDQWIAVTASLTQYVTFPRIIAHSWWTTEISFDGYCPYTKGCMANIYTATDQTTPLLTWTSSNLTTGPSGQIKTMKIAASADAGLYNRVTVNFESGYGNADGNVPNQVFGSLYIFNITLHGPYRSEADALIAEPPAISTNVSTTNGMPTTTSSNVLTTTASTTISSTSSIASSDPDACLAGNVSSTDKTSTFAVQCGRYWFANDANRIKYLTANLFQQCIDACGATPACVGTVYLTPSKANGDNCQLLNNTAAGGSTNQYYRLSSRNP